MTKNGRPQHSRFSRSVKRSYVGSESSADPWKSTDLESHLLTYVIWTNPVIKNLAYGMEGRGREGCKKTGPDLLLFQYAASRPSYRPSSWVVVLISTRATVMACRGEPLIAPSACNQPLTLDF